MGVRGSCVVNRLWNAHTTHERELGTIDDDFSIVTCPAREIQVETDPGRTTARAHVTTHEVFVSRSAETRAAEILVSGTRGTRGITCSTRFAATALIFRPRHDATPIDRLKGIVGTRDVLAVRDGDLTVGGRMDASGERLSGKVPTVGDRRDSPVAARNDLCVAAVFALCAWRTAAQRLGVDR